jgi:hypothetical protein
MHVTSQTVPRAAGRSEVMRHPMKMRGLAAQEEVVTVPSGQLRCGKYLHKGTTYPAPKPLCHLIFQCFTPRLKRSGDLATFYHRPDSLQAQFFFQIEETEIGRCVCRHPGGRTTSPKLPTSSTGFWDGCPILDRCRVSCTEVLRERTCPMFAPAQPSGHADSWRTARGKVLRGAELQRHVGLQTECTRLLLIGNSLCRSKGKCRYKVSRNVHAFRECQLSA